MPPPFTAAQALAFPHEPGQDRVAVFEREEVLILVVTDGAGGISGGAQAAELVVKLVEAAVIAPSFDPLRPELWIELLARVDLALDADPQAGETTGVVVALFEHALVGASCGDSGAWMATAEGIEDLTAHQHRKLRLGSGRARPVSFSRPKLDGTLLVATDGLINYARAERIAQVARHADLDQAAKGLVQLVRLPSGGLQDDVGLMLVRPES